MGVAVWKADTRMEMLNTSRESTDRETVSQRVAGHNFSSQSSAWPTPTGKCRFDSGWVVDGLVATGLQFDSA